jgi:hypothetical protein
MLKLFRLLFGGLGLLSVSRCTAQMIDIEDLEEIDRVHGPARDIAYYVGSDSYSEFGNEKEKRYNRRYIIGPNGNIVVLDDILKRDSIVYTYGKDLKVVSAVWTRHLKAALPSQQSFVRRCVNRYDSSGVLTLSDCYELPGDSIMNTISYSYDAAGGFAAAFAAALWMKGGEIQRSVTYIRTGASVVKRQISSMYGGGYRLIEYRYGDDGHVEGYREGLLHDVGDTILRSPYIISYKNNRFGDPVLAVRSRWNAGTDTLMYKYSYDRYDNWVKRKQFLRSSNAPFGKAKVKSLGTDYREIVYSSSKRRK